MFRACLVTFSLLFPAAAQAVESHQRVCERYWVFDRGVNLPVQVAVDLAPRSADGAAAPFDAVGEDWWEVGVADRAHLDTFRPLIAGDAEVAVGRHRMVMRRVDGSWALGLVPRGAQAAAVEVALSASTATERTESLEARVVDRSSKGFALEFAWGEQLLRAEFETVWPELPSDREAPADRFAVMGGRTPRRELVADLGNGESLRVAYSTVPWKPQLASVDALRGAMRKGAWRIGKNFWTEIESSRAMRAKTSWIGKGHFFASVRRAGDGFELCLHAPSQVRDALVDSFWSENAPVFARLPLELSASESIAEELAIELTPVEGEPRFFDFRIAWGPHRLGTRIELGQSTSAAPVVGTTHGWAQDEERDSTRLIYFDKTEGAPWNASPGQVSIEFGRAPWKDAYGPLLEKSRTTDVPADEVHRRRWRMGTNMWTNLDTRVPLRFADRTVPRGYYYLLLEVGADEIALLIVDPESLAGDRFDAWHANRRPMSDPVRVPLVHRVVDDVAEVLDIAFGLPGDDPRDATLEIRFGPHRLSTELRCEFEPGSE